MKKISLAIIGLLLIAPTAHAAPTGVTVKKLDRLVSAAGAEGLIIAGKNLITFGNTGSTNSNVVVTALDLNGIQVWQKTIDSGVDEIATAAAPDSAGNIWLAGTSALLGAADTSTAPVVTDNPDTVVVEPKQKLRSDLTQITLWKLSSAGEVLGTYAAPQGAPVLINALSVNTSGISLVGTFGGKSFLINASLAGIFSKPTYIGSAKTSLNSVVRNSDGSINVFGSSSDTLAGKKSMGTVDGVLIKVAKTGALASVVRSTAPKAARSWLSADSTLALTGSVKTGKTIESAFTKFTSAFAPTWTLRIPSDGNSFVTTSATTYGVIGSTGPVAGINGWKPTAPSLLLLAFDGKGVITGAYGASDMASPLALASSKDAGVYGLAKGSDQSVSIFHLVTR